MLLNVLLVAFLGLDGEFEYVVMAEAVRTLKQVFGAPVVLAKANLEVTGREYKSLELAALRWHILRATVRDVLPLSLVQQNLVREVSSSHYKIPYLDLDVLVMPPMGESGSTIDTLKLFG